MAQVPWRETARGRAVTRYRQSLRGCAYHLRRGAKSRAAKKGVDFNLTIEQIFHKLKSGKCSVTGIPFSYERSASGPGPFSPSLDRIDPKKGYTNGNTRVVIFAFNLAHGNWGEETTLQVAKEIVKALGKRTLQ